MHWAALVHGCPCFFLQAPLPSQVFAPVQLLGSSAFFTSTQVPFAPVQDSHSPQDELQHTPSVQDPLVHSAADPQTLPFPFFGVQTPALQ